MSRSYGSSTLQYLGTAPIRRPYEPPIRGLISSDCGSSRLRAPWPAATAAWPNEAERQARSGSVGKTLPSVRFYQFGRRRRSLHLVFVLRRKFPVADHPEVWVPTSKSESSCFKALRPSNQGPF